jgi:hypothetical protein
MCGHRPNKRRADRGSRLHDSGQAPPFAYKSPSYRWELKFVVLIYNRTSEGLDEGPLPSGLAGGRARETVSLTHTPGLPIGGLTVGPASDRAGEKRKHVQLHITHSLNWEREAAVGAGYGLEEDVTSGGGRA